MYHVRYGKRAGCYRVLVPLLMPSQSLTQRFFGLLTWVRLDQDELGLHNPVGNHALLYFIMQDGDQSAGEAPPPPQCQIVLPIPKQL